MAKPTTIAITTPTRRDCSKMQLDLKFLVQAIDELYPSGSGQIKSFMTKVATKFKLGKDDVQVSIMQFTDHILHDEEMDFIEFGSTQLRPQLREFISTMHLHGGLSHPPGPILRDTIDEYLSDSSTSGAREGVRKAVVFIMGMIDDKAIPEFNSALREAHMKNITTLLVYIPSENEIESGNLDLKFEKIYEMKLKNKVILKDRFNELYKNTLQNFIAERICQDRPEALTLATLPPTTHATTSASTTTGEYVESTTMSYTTSELYTTTAEVEERCTYPNEVIIVADTSSLTEPDLIKLKTFLTSVVQGFKNGENQTTFGLVSYGTNPTTIQDIKTASNTQDELLENIDSISASGQITNTGAALIMAEKILEYEGSDKPWHILLITDARAKDDLGDALSYLQKLRNTHEAGVGMSVVGLGAATPIYISTVFPNTPTLYVQLYNQLQEKTAVSQTISNVCYYEYKKVTSTTAAEFTSATTGATIPPTTPTVPAISPTSPSFTSPHATTKRLTTIVTSPIGSTVPCSCYWTDYISSTNPDELGDYEAWASPENNFNNICGPNMEAYSILCKSDNGQLQPNLKCAYPNAPRCLNFEVPLNDEMCFNYSVSIKCCSEGCGEKPPLEKKEPPKECKMDFVFLIDGLQKKDDIRLTKMFLHDVTKAYKFDKTNIRASLIEYGYPSPKVLARWETNTENWLKSINGLKPYEYGGKITDGLLFIENEFKSTMLKDKHTTLFALVTENSFGVVDGVLNRLNFDNITAIGVGNIRKNLFNRLGNKYSRKTVPNFSALGSLPKDLLEPICKPYKLVEVTFPTTTRPVETRTTTTEATTEKYVETTPQVAYESTFAVSPKLTSPVEETTISSTGVVYTQTTIETTVLPEETTTITTTVTPEITPPPSQCIYYNIKEGKFMVMAEGELYYPNPSDRCSYYECVDSSVTLQNKKLSCESLSQPQCSNGYSPVIHYDGQCNCQWDCQCQCKVSGDPVYHTFNGESYTINGDCEYALAVASQRALRSNRSFEIYHKQGPCKENENLVCVIEIEVQRNGMNFKIDHNNSVLLNNRPILLPYTAKSTRVKLVGQRKFVIRFGDIGLQVEYIPSENTATVSLPAYLWEGDIRGMCGDCNHEAGMRLENGSYTDDLILFAESWKKPGMQCSKSVLLEKLEQSSDSLCEQIATGLNFEECRKQITWEHFYINCINDTNGKVNMLCSSLSAFAEACRSAGVCVNWRTTTICPLTCEDNFTYNPCMKESAIPVCFSQEVYNGYEDGEEDLFQEEDPAMLIEGCFLNCSMGEVIINNKCEPKQACSQCFDQDAKVYREVDLEWIPSDNLCSKCVCDSNLKIYCKQKPCDSHEMPECNECAKLSKIDSSDPCCPQYECVCDASRCEANPPSQSCENGAIMTLITNSSSCRPFYKCECDKSRCTNDQVQCDGGMELFITATECCNKTTCECPATCNDIDTTCDVGYSRTVHTDVCGCESNVTCIQLPYCVLNITGKFELKSLNDKWMHAERPCVKCKCVYNSDEDVYKEECQSLENECDECEQGYQAKEIRDQCCPSCEQYQCIVTNTGGVKTYYDIGEELPRNETDSCVILTCENENGIVRVSKSNVVCKPVSQSVCDFGFTQKCTIENCCPECLCVPEDVCIYNTSLHAQGDKWTIDACTECRCTDNMSQSGFYQHICTTTQCDPCKDGYKNLHIDGLCCGRCVPEICNITLGDGSTHLLEIGYQFKTNCSIYKCVENRDGYAISIQNEIQCPVVDKAECIHLGGTLVTDANGCCSKCEMTQRQCQPRIGNPQKFSIDGCVTKEITMPYCEGQCASSTHYHQDHYFSHHCTCCQQETFTNITHPALCPDGSVKEIEFRYVTSCTCAQVLCTEQQHSGISSHDIVVANDILPKSTSTIVTSWGSREDDTVNVVEITDVDSARDININNIIQEALQKYGIANLKFKTVKVSATNSSMSEAMERSLTNFIP